MNDSSSNVDVDRRLRALAVAALGSLAAEPVYVLVDTAIVGRTLGTAQLGGLAVAATVLGFVAAAANFLTYGTTERVARLVGAGRHDDAADTGMQAMWLSSFIGIGAMGLLVAGAGAFATVLGADGDVATAAVTYLRISALGIPFVVLALGAQGVMRGVSDYRTPLVILVASNLLNVGLEVLFVVVAGWGMAGSAWSTVIAQAIAGAAFVVALRRPLRPARERRPRRSGMQPLMTAGAHLLLRVTAMLVVLSVATAVAARIDEPTLAAHQIVTGLLGFIALSLDSVAVPAQTLVAEQLGRSSPRVPECFDATECSVDPARASRTPTPAVEAPPLPAAECFDATECFEDPVRASRPPTPAIEAPPLPAAECFDATECSVHPVRASRPPTPADGMAETRHVARRVVVLSVVVGLGIAALVAVLAWWIPGWFTNDPEVVERARAALWWMAGLLPVAALAYATDGILIGAADYRFIGRAALAYAVVVVPVLLAALVWRDVGIAGVWFAIAVWMVLRAVTNRRRVAVLLTPAR